MKNMGNLDDLWKKEREELDKSGSGGEIFKSSKKTERSPIKVDIETKKKELREMIREMREDFKNIS